jgi:N-acetylmuramoyl-L-alanine amidase
LKNARDDWNVLLPGDRVTIPPPTPKAEVRATGSSYVFRRLAVPIPLQVEFCDEAGKPYASEAFVAEGPNFRGKGTTDGEGLLDILIPAELRKVRITFTKLSDAVDLEIGTLDPAHSVAGIQARLNNLGFHCGPVDGTLTPLTVAALALYRAEHKLATNPDQILDEATLDHLRTTHGS